MLYKRSHLATAAVVVLMLGVAGCGGSGGGSDLADRNSPGADPGSSSGSGQASDSFVSRVMQIIGSTSENSEPVEIDSINATSPDNTEPLPIS